MVITFRSAQAVEKALKAIEKGLEKAYDGNVELIGQRIGPRRVKVSLWVDDPDGPGGKRGITGRRLHAANWHAWGVLIYGALINGATRVQGRFGVWRSDGTPENGEAVFWEHAQPWAHAPIAWGITEGQLAVDYHVLGLGSAKTVLSRVTIEAYHRDGGDL